MGMHFESEGIVPLVLASCLSAYSHIGALPLQPEPLCRSRCGDLVFSPSHHLKNRRCETAGVLDLEVTAVVT